MKKTYIGILAIAGALTFSSCGSSETEETAKKPETTVKDNGGNSADTSNETSDDVEMEESYEFVPPSTIQIASIFKKAGLTYDGNILNDPAKAESYNDKFIQALNFGVFSSDLSVCVLNEQTEVAKSYLKVVKDLGEKIGINTVLNDADVIERFNNNINNQDSIVEILFYIHENTEEYIAQEGKDDLAVIYYTGAWIEGMYFGALKAKSEPENKELGYLISEQMGLANSLHKGLEVLNAENIDAQDLAGSIKELVDTYYSMESVVALGEDAEYLSVDLTPEEITTLSDAIIELRTGITE